jgi:UDP-N-acetylglucosamine transferase subunit ALG13/precorrin-6B methylase 2
VGNHFEGFDRLIMTIDTLVLRGEIKEKVVAQIGHTKYKPKNIEYRDFFGFYKYKDLIRKSRLIITHGGAGSIISGLKYNKTLIVVPRYKRFNEHVNDHQIELTQALEKEKRIIAVYNINDLLGRIKEAKKFRGGYKKTNKEIKNIIENYLKMMERNCWNNFWTKDKKKKFSWAKFRVINILSKMEFKNKRVLDAGCGSGFFSKYFKERGAKVTALDFSDNALKMTRKIVNCETINSDVRKILKKSNYYDFIFSDGLLEHFDNPSEVLMEVKRVLKKNGKIITFVPNQYSFWQIIRPFIMKSIKEMPFTMRKLLQLHKKNDLNVLSYGGVNVIPSKYSPEFLGKKFGMLLYVLASKK